jgi:VIT1/CCC1 family predicted Fe2+/Mn2+ transporter
MRKMQGWVLRRDACSRILAVYLETRPDTSIALGYQRWNSSRAVVLFFVIAAAAPVVSGFLVHVFETALATITIVVISGTCSVIIVIAHCSSIVKINEG